VKEVGARWKDVGAGDGHEPSHPAAFLPTRIKRERGSKSYQRASRSKPRWSRRDIAGCSLGVRSRSVGRCLANWQINRVGPFFIVSCTTARRRAREALRNVGVSQRWTDARARCDSQSLQQSESSVMILRHSRTDQASSADNNLITAAGVGAETSVRPSGRPTPAFCVVRN